MLFVLLSAVAALAAAHPLTDMETDWVEFKAVHGKQYADEAEDAYRMKIWAENAEYIHAHNKGNSSFTMAMNAFGDLTDEEFANFYLSPGYYGIRQPSGSTFMPNADSVTAATVDWRTKGYVTPIKNQGACGSCWAFSTTGSLEGQHFKKTGRLVSLSEQNLVDCSQKYGNHGCEGGLMDNAFRYIKANGGIDTEESYPYTAKNGICKFEASNVGATVTGYTDIPRGSETSLQEAVSSVGPVSVAMDAHLTSFRFYHSGIYKDFECSSTKLDHGVLAVGYGKEELGKYWIVKNSWGTTWGNEGYFYLARDDGNMCGIATAASYPLV